MSEEDDLNQEISAVSKHMAEKESIVSHKAKSSNQTYKWLLVAVVWLVAFYTFAQFDRELATVFTSVSQDELDGSTDTILGDVARGVEAFYRDNGDLPDVLPPSYLSNLVLYTKTDASHYQLTFTLNGIQTINHYAISYQVGTDSGE